MLNSDTVKATSWFQGLDKKTQGLVLSDVKSYVKAKKASNQLGDENDAETLEAWRNKYITSNPFVVKHKPGKHDNANQNIEGVSTFTVHADNVNENTPDVSSKPLRNLVADGPASSSSSASTPEPTAPKNTPNTDPDAYAKGQTAQDSLREDYYHPMDSKKDDASLFMDAIRRNPSFGYLKRQQIRDMYDKKEVQQAWVDQRSLFQKANSDKTYRTRGDYLDALYGYAFNGLNTPGSKNFIDQLNLASEGWRKDNQEKGETQPPLSYGNKIPGKTTTATFSETPHFSSNTAPGPSNVNNNNNNTILNGLGSYAPGLGVRQSDGSYSKGRTHNVGGGIIDTEYVEDEKTGGDILKSGPQSVSVATKTLRPRFVIAGGEDVRPSHEANMQSDALFEAFSWVPDGYGLGEYNNLHLMNLQNDHLRFGMEPMYEPRRWEDNLPTHDEQAEWDNDMSQEQLQAHFMRDVGKDILDNMTHQNQSKRPSYVLDNDYNAIPSSKGLPRGSTVSPFQGIIDTKTMLLPSHDPSGAYMNKVSFENTVTGTQTLKRQRVFGVV